MKNDSAYLLGIVTGLLLVAAFMLGRAYGWHEADVFMANMAKSLQGLH